MAEVLADGNLSRAEASNYRKAARDVMAEFDRSRPGLGLLIASRAAAESMAPSRQEAGKAADHAAAAVASARYYDGGNPSGYIVDWHREIEAEHREQVPLFRDIFGNPFRPVAFDPRWRTDDVLGLARGIYEDRAFDRLPLLADALMDAGCDSDDILNHCRTEGPHVRGCWVVDLVLGKE